MTTSIRSAQQAVDIATEWVARESATIPGFRGAHLLGSINHRPRSEPFPAYLDVDIAVVVERPETGPTMELPYRGMTQANGEMAYRGLILEAVYFSHAAYQSAETVLSNPTVAPSLATDCILQDDTGWLADLQRVVARDFGKRRWAEARCEDQKRLVHATAAQLEQVIDWPLSSFLPLALGKYLASFVALADLRPATHRRSLVVMEQVLRGAGRPDLHARALEVLGLGSLDAKEVEAFFHDSMEAFDLAALVKRTQSPFSYKIEPHTRPIFAEGTQEMLDEGYHREAMPWICLGCWVANGVIQNDASSEQKMVFQQKSDRLFSRLGLGTAAERRRCLDEIRRLSEQMFQWADARLKALPA